MMSDAIRWYDQNVSDVSRRYDLWQPRPFMAGWSTCFQSHRRWYWMSVRGTGRDAAWLASRGLEVVAVEPSGAMRAEAQRLHAFAFDPMDQRILLPSSNGVLRLGLSFDLILLSAVWMHVPPTDRARSFRNLVTLLKPGGRMAITLRHGPVELERGIHTVSQAEIESLVADARKSFC